MAQLVWIIWFRMFSHRSCLLLTSVVGLCQSKIRLPCQPSPPVYLRARWKALSLRCVLGPLWGSLLSWTRLKHLCGGHVLTRSRNHFSCFSLDVEDSRSSLSASWTSELVIVSVRMSPDTLQEDTRIVFVIFFCGGGGEEQLFNVCKVQSFLSGDFTNNLSSLSGL